MTKLTQKSLVRAGAYSAVSVAVLASILPMPRPLTNRASTSMGTEGTYTVASTQLPIKAADSIIIRRRPITSACAAKNIAPTAIPNSPTLNTRPRSVGLMAHSLAMAGAV